MQLADREIRLSYQEDLPLSAIAEPVTLLLVGGGIRFPAVIGALQAIEDSGLNVTRVIASSTAAIVAGMYACGSTPGTILDETLALDTRQFKDVSLRSMVTGYGLCAGRRLEEWVDSTLGSARFGSAMRLPFEIVATDMYRYRPVTFSAERSPDLKIATAAAATSHVPGLFAYRKLRHDGKNYALVDGSLMSGIVEGRLDRSQRVLVIKMMSKRTLKRPDNGRLSPQRYFREMLAFSLHAQEKEFLKGGKWKDTIIIYCGEISPARFSLTREEKLYLYEQGLDQTRKYLDYKWGGQPGSTC
jgi:NTE family protein